MKREHHEMTVGALVLASLFFLAWLAGGKRGLWFAVWLVIGAIVLSAMWHSKHKALKFFAFLLLPFLAIGTWLAKRSYEEATRKNTDIE
jgi:hypothetical protein